MPYPDGTLTLDEVIRAEEDRLKNAISVNHAHGMDAGVLMGATMKYLKGRANPVEVNRLIREFLSNGHRFS